MSGTTIRTQATKLPSRLREQWNAFMEQEDALLLGGANGALTAPGIGNGSTAGRLALLDVNSLRAQQNVPMVSGAIGDGGTNGRLRTTAAISFRIGGALYTKASTDDLWNLSALTTLGAAEYQATYLYLDSGGTATIASGTAAASAAAAYAALPKITSTKAVIGVFLASPLCNYANALAAQGVITNGLPSDLAYAGAPLAVSYAIGGRIYTKVATDDLWNLSALATLLASQYRATALYLDSSGAATIASSAVAASAALAIAGLEDIPSTKARVAVYVAGPLTNYSNALAAQGTIYNGLPAAPANAGSQILVMN